jgi:outer membrane protein assembly factor BamD
LRAIAVLLLTIATASAPALAKDSDDKKPAKKDKSAQELYEDGLRHMQHGYYTKALDEFNHVRNYFRDDPLSVKAELAIADVYFKKGDFEQARYAYEEFATYHPRSENLDYVTWRDGLSIYKRASKWAGRDQTSTRGAVNVWTGFDARFPESSYTEDVDKLLGRARDRLAAKELYIAKFYAGRKSWGAVADRARGVVERYPESGRVPTALRMLGTALHAWGDVDGAARVREQLAARPDADGSLAKLDRKLARPPGAKPEEELFIRPYRIRSSPTPPVSQPANTTR